MKIGILGAGGIGSNVAVNLVRSGVSNLKIADFDRIDLSNLNRQFYFHDQIGKSKVEMLKENLERIAPDLEIEIIDTKIEETNAKELFDDCDILVEAFDKKEYKKLLIEEFHSSNKLIVSASGIAHHDTDNILTKKFGENIYVVGDFKKGIEEYKTYSPKVLIVASIMANIVMEKGGYYEEV
ncbi:MULTISPECIES: sulfur carrier protein ThiS adenylyltransferase ThiF [Psychrilyobacter]|uniref:Sulfur carrier protein ThiS adenylyltransferase ThiF n=1 Tax=Psychrilyobacter piezotolerans TaxID=2293438 RepID=A0ABX9KDD5_9FUSO|nr:MULTISPECIES: sulfur carrier protein ThiS adenylyltransferase ThiF [Psychrilyobacter]MCS5422371.1 sulfur carrier protein ThiS adenylyltransferase ThiF [Psychrilyobacter sp. S5]NDI79104.1 sulfur carrier protein ThiS adenylyltransferase ThiF [Psychrilyobacter piezotolerans]RDE58979.1 sulfur carrier protein ThiS adenylyltransferase ThiF [Psychrilyobacter sp. S5]REI39546.1 sulfur carrier protein ThiS adenylyltransferase ThiF [Psychrilyobacter piezotolerans]